MTGASFLDDNAKNLYSSNAKHKICFGEEYEWNRNWKNERLVNWCDVYRKFVGGEIREF